MSTIIEELAIKLGADISDYQRKLAAASQQMQTMSDRFGQFSTKMSSIGRSLTLVAGGMAAGMSVMAGRYNSAMNEVWSITDKSSEQMGEWRDSVIKMSSEIGVSATGQAKALYQIVSAGVATSDAMQVLTVSAKAAKAGFADQTQVVDALTSVMNVYKLTAAESARVSDLFFESVRLGKLNMQQLASSIGTALPVAKELGVSLEELLSWLVEMTKGGYSADEAITSMRAALMEVLTATDEQKKAARDLGIEFDYNAIKSKGLTQFFKELKEATGGNTEEVAKLFKNARSLGAALLMTGERSEDFTKTLKDLQNASGATDKALEKLSKTVEEKLEKALENLKNTMIAVGTSLREQWAEVYESMKPFIEGVETLLQTYPNFFAAITNSILVLGGLALAISAVAKVCQILAMSFALLAANPFVAALLVTIALVAAAIGIYNSFNEEIDNSIDLTKEHAKWQQQAAQEAYEASRARIQQLKAEKASMEAMSQAWEKFAVRLAKLTPSRVDELKDSFAAIKAQMDRRLTEEERLTAQLEAEYKKREALIRERLEWEINETKKYRNFDEQSLEDYLQEVAEKHRRLTDQVKDELDKQYRHHLVVESLELKGFELVTQKRVKLFQDEMQKRVRAAQDMVSKIKGFEQELMDLARARQNWTDSIEDALLRIRKTGMTDEQKYKADEAQAWKYVDKAKTAAAGGDYEQAEAYVQRAMSLFEGLAREVRDANGNVVISLEQGFKAAETGLLRLDRLMVDVFSDREFELTNQLADAQNRLSELRKEFEQLQAQAQQEMEIKFKTEDAKDKLRELADEFHKFAKDLNLTLTATINGQKPEKHAAGGWVGGAAGTDNVPAMLTRGEYVVNAQAASKFSSLLERINGGGRMTSGHFAGGSSGGANVTIVVNEKLTRDYIRDVLAPEIQRSTSRRRN